VGGVLKKKIAQRRTIKKKQEKRRSVRSLEKTIAEREKRKKTKK